MFHAQNPAPRADYSSGSQIEELARRFSLRQLRRHSMTLRQMELRETSLYVSARLRDFFLDFQSMLWRVTIPFRLRMRRGRLRSVREILWAAARTYVPGPYSGSVALFRSTERRAEAFEDFHGGWREVVSGPIDVHEIPGKYWAIYSEPAVETTAEEMSKCLLTAHTQGDRTWRARLSSGAAQDSLFPRTPVSHNL
jgi:thioesterase domain-containing protein